MKVSEGGATVDGELGVPDQGSSDSNDSSDEVGRTTW
jgi:hypothetical protein